MTEGIQRIDWSGETPFEVLTMRLSRDGSGFRLRFTAEADRATAADPASYSMESFTYAATQRYGSPELDRADVDVVEARVHEDGRGVDLVVEGMREGYVHASPPAGSGRRALSLLHPDVFYTLVRSW